jgi:hypothetical protein
MWMDGVTRKARFDITGERSFGCPVGCNGCQCDEYPFAATLNGASFDDGVRVSVKYVEGKDNNDSGRPSGNFYRRERILDFNSYPLNGPLVLGDKFWVYAGEVKP